MDRKKSILTGLIRRHRKAVLVFLFFALAAAVLGIKGRAGAQDFTGKAEREAEGGSIRSQTFSFHLESSGEQEMTVEIAPVERSMEEAMQLIEEAMQLIEEACSQWEECYLGGNTSPEEIRTALELPEELCGGLVLVTYESSDSSVLQPDGEIVPEELPEEGKLVELTVHFSYGDYRQTEVIPLRVMPPEKYSVPWIRMQLQEEIRQVESSTRQESSFSLPDEIAGQKIYWEEKQNMEWLLILFFGAVSAICLERKEKEAQKTREKKRRQQLLLEYPGMVEQITVLLESGMTIRRAWKQMIGREPDRGHPDRICLSEMQVTYREIQEGRGEREAYERFGNRIGLLPYRRFSSVLTQNLLKGTRDMQQILRKEAAEALEMRKNQAKKAGEEAGTKMLFPMLVMLLLILMILLLPALTGL